MTTPKGFRNMKRELEKLSQISSELQKMHEIFGDPNANCRTAAQYEDGTCSKIVYDPAKMSFKERLRQQQEIAIGERPGQPTQEEIKAKRVLQFSTFLNPKSRRS